MKKALIITSISGFLFQFEMNDVRTLQTLGYEVHYASNMNCPIYTFDKAKLMESGIVVHHIDIEKKPFFIIGNIKAFFQLKKLLKEKQFDLIHCHNPVGGLLGRLLGVGNHKAPYIIYTAHGFHFYKKAPLINWILYFSVEKILARFTDVLITINHEDEQCAEKMPIRKGGFCKKINGVGLDLTRFYPQIKIADQMRQEINIPENAFHIVTAAELNDNKNQVSIIKALAKMKDKDIYYSICGRGCNERKLCKLIKKYELEENVRLLGYRLDMPHILQTADCFAFPSIREGMGMAALEALACGVPLIAADNRGTREYCVDGFNNIVCPSKDIDAYAYAIKKLKEDKAFRYYLKENCRSSVNDFSILAVSEKMFEIYKRADEYITKNKWKTE